MYLAFCSLLSSVFLPFRWVLFLSLCFSLLTIACVYFFFFGLFRVSFLFRPFFLLKRCVLNYFQFLAFCIVAAVPFFLSTVFSPFLQKKKTVSLSSTRKRVDTSTHTFFYHYLKLLLFFFFFFLVLAVSRPTFAHHALATPSWCEFPWGILPRCRLGLPGGLCDGDHRGVPAVTFHHGFW